MTVRLARLNVAAHVYVEDFYRRHPHIRRASFTEQRDALAADFAWGSGDAWTHALAPLGYDVEEYTITARPAQLAWAREHGIEHSEARWLGEIALAQVEAASADVLWVGDAGHLDADWVREARTRTPTLRLVIGWCGAPYTDLDAFAPMDLVLSCVPELVEGFRKAGIPSHQLHHAFDPRVLPHLAEDQPGSGDLVTFVGRITRDAGYHLERERLLTAVARAAGPLTIYSPSAVLPRSEALRLPVRRALYQLAQLMTRSGVPTGVIRQSRRLARALELGEPPTLRVSPFLRRRMQPAVYGLEYLRVLRRSKLTLNQHIDVSSRHASNRRLWEATGVGTCLVTDVKANLANLFEPDREVVTYDSPEECIERVRWLLDDEDARSGIAKAGQQRTLRDHTYEVRAGELVRIVEHALRSPRSPSA